jgi:hypothetical protein
MIHAPAIFSDFSEQSMKRILVCFILLLSPGTCTEAQTGLIAMPVEIGISHRTGQPFTATEVTTITQTLADGTKITRTAEDHIARDSGGRFYKEQHFPWTHDSRNPVYYVYIYDPSVKERIHLDPQKHLAMQGPAEPMYTRDYKPNEDLAIRATRKGETVKTEKLDNQDISGLHCWGRRTTRLVPRGAFGNDQPIEIVDEFWYSDELGLDIVRRHSDPRSGEQVSELHDLQRSEPAPEIFKVPQGFTIQPLPPPRTR